MRRLLLLAFLSLPLVAQTPDCSLGLQNAGAWTAFNPNVSNLSNLSYDAAYMQCGKTVFVRVRLQGISNGSYVSFYLPTGVASLGQSIAIVYGGVGGGAAFVVNTSGYVICSVYNATTPASGANVDIRGSGVYESN